MAEDDSVGSRLRIHEHGHVGRHRSFASDRDQRAKPDLIDGFMQNWNAAFTKAATRGTRNCPRAVATTLDDDVQKIRRTLESFLAALNNLEWTPFIELFAEDAQFFSPMTGDAERIDGREAIATFFRRTFEDIKEDSGRSTAPYQDLVARDLRVQVAADVALATFHLVTTDGSTRRRTFVFKKQTDGWKIIHLHASNLEPD